MASTYSPTLRIELIGDGDQSGIWGQTTNNNLGSLLEQAITGVVTILMVDANYTLTSYNGVVDEARNAVIVATGTNSAQRDIIAPLVEKTYTIKNSTTGGYAVRIIGTTGTGIVIPNGVTASVYCDGTNFYNLQVGTTGNETINGNLTVIGTTTLQGALTATTATFSGAISSVSPTFTGVPVAPTAASGTSTTQIATTAFVQNFVGTLGSMAYQNSNAVSITGGSVTGLSSLGSSAATISGALSSGSFSTGSATVSGALSAGSLAGGASTGAGASGTWNINVSGNAATATNINSTTPNLGYSLSGQDMSYGGQGGPMVQSQGSGAAMMTFLRPGVYGVNFGIGTDNQLRTGGWSRGGASYVILDSGNYNSYAPTLTGGNASGTWGINISGNSATVTNGVYNNGGTYNINISGNSATVTNGVYNNGGSYNIRSYPRRSDGADINFIWSGQGGQPTWLWGGNDGNNMYIYNPSNFSVSYANSAGQATNASNVNGGNVACSGIQVTATSPTIWMYDSDQQDFAMHVNSNLWYVLNQGGSGIMYVDQSGNFTAVGNVTAYSDESIKDNWKPLDDDYLEKLVQVKSGTYDRTDLENKRQAGVSAQDIQKILPEVVQELQDHKLSLAYGNLAVVTCIKLAERLLALEAEVKALKGE